MTSKPQAESNYTLVDAVGERVVYALSVYYTPGLVLCGTVGNLLILCVFYSTKLRHQSTSQYLSALAVSDTAYLLQLLPPWLNTLQASDLFYRGGFCQLFMYLSYVSSSLSAWLVVAFTAERFVAVLHPLRRNAVCSVRRARHIIFGLATAAVLLNTPVLRFVRSVPSSRDCSIDLDYLKHAARFNLIDTLVTFTLPLGIVMIMNVMITSGVCRVDRERLQLMRATHPPLPVRPWPERRPPTPPRSQTRVTRMLLVVSSVFVLFNLPAYSMRLLTYTWDLNLKTHSGRWHAVQHIAVTFFNTNFGINFLLYCLTGQNFRRALRDCSPCCCRARRRAAIRRANLAQRAHSVSNSFVSITEAGGSPRQPVEAPGGSSGSYIKRWKFDNSRQRQRQQQRQQPRVCEDIPMRVFRSDARAGQ